MQQNNISLDILTHSKSMREYPHEGKTFVESREGSKYAIRVKNHSSKRVKIVTSVDGLNVINGKQAGDDPSEVGYVLGPYEENVIKGFRVDDDTVAEFTFVKREKSYATEVGSGAGNGVIAVRVYEEKQKPEDVAKIWRDLYEKERNRPREREYIPYDRPYPVYPWRPYWERPYCGDVWYGGYVKESTTDARGVAFGDGNITSTTAMFNTASNDMGELRSASFTQCCAQSEVTAKDENPFSMGSAWGGAIKDSVTTVEFEVGKLLTEVTVYYAALEGLKALGVNVDRVKTVAFPEPFKKTYCAKPSGWKG